MAKLRGFKKKKNSYASTMASSFYKDEAILLKEMEKIFKKSWQYIGSTEKLTVSGDYMAMELFGEPLLALKDEQNSIQVLSNVCRHRAGLLAEGFGHKKIFACPYHAWSYDLKGELKNAPELDLQPHEKKKFCLPRFDFKSWGPFGFVGLKPGLKSFEQFFGNIRQETQKEGYNLDDYQFIYRKDYVVNCNWKVYTDNYLEGYHIPTVHPDLNRELDYKNYKVEPEGLVIKQYAPLRPAQDATQRTYVPEAHDSKRPLYYWVFPNFILNFYPDNLSVNWIMPLDIERTLTVFEWYVPKSQPAPSPEEVMHLTAFSDQVQHEDIKICEAVQKGLSSSQYRSGIYHPARENGVKYFHQLYLKSLKGR